MKRRITSIVLAGLLALLAEQAFGQFYQIPYYGKNKVVYSKFDWQSYATEHFRIYSYSPDPGVLKTVAEMAESAYRKISDLLKHQIGEPVPLIYYGTYTDFEQTNLFEVSEGVLGVSEPILHRIGIHGDMPPDELQNLIEHELTHVFEFDIIWGSLGGPLFALAQPPLWTFEGLSEYVTGEWSSWSTIIVRDAVLNDRIPGFADNGEIVSTSPLPREPAYDFGHATYEFIESRFGKNAVREFWQVLKTTSPFAKQDLFKRAFNLKSRDFEHEFKKFLRARNQAYLVRENPEDYSIALGPQYPANPYYFSFSHDLSPSGDLAATLSFNAKTFDLDLVLVSVKDGSVVKNITSGYSTRFESIRRDVDASLGKALAWSPDGDRIAFFARDGRKHSLFLVDVTSGKIVSRRRVAIDQPVSPSFFPSGSEILFSGFENGRHDIFKISLADGKIENLSGDEPYQKAPAISPDGKLVAYTLRLNGFDRIVVAPIQDIKKGAILATGKGNAITPRFSQDSREIFFSGDVFDAYNIYSVHLDTGLMKRYTDVRTGNFYPTPVPGRPGAIVFASFNKGAFQLFRTEREGSIEGRIALNEPVRETEMARFKPQLSLDFDKDKIKKHSGLGKMYILQRPPVEAVVSTDGSIYGGSSVTVGDLMGDHSFSFSAYQVRDFKSYFLNYLNQRGRLQYMVSAFSFVLYYYANSYLLNSDVYNQYYTYQDALATKKIAGLQLVSLYPFSKYLRAEMGLNLIRYEEDYIGALGFSPSAGQSRAYFWNGSICQATAALVGETTFFKEYGPISGSTFRVSLAQGIPLTKNYFRNTTLGIDLRRYFRVGSDALFAFRAEGFASFGRNPYYNYFGGNNQVRSAYYNSLVGSQGFWLNAEFRFPLLYQAATFLGVLGPIRGVLFADVARTKIKGYPSQIWRSVIEDGVSTYKPFEAIGSYGYGIEFFLFGFPLHFDFVKAINIPKFAKPFKFEKGSSFETNFWIGFDF